MKKTILRGDHNQCPSCLSMFNSGAAFDKHRVGDYSPLNRRCLTVTEMLGKGMAVNTAGFWVTKPDSRGFE